MPLVLNTEPRADAALPGVTGFAGPQVLTGAPLWPVVGLTMADAAVGAAPTRLAAKAAARTYFRMCSSRALVSGGLSHRSTIGAPRPHFLHGCPRLPVQRSGSVTGTRARRTCRPCASRRYR